MALDPSIILQAGKGVTPLLNPTEIQDQQMQRELGGYKLSQVRQAMADDQAMREVAQSTPQNGLADAYLKRGLVKPAQEAQKFQTEQAKAAREAEKAKLEAGLKHFEVVGQIMTGVKDQASYDQARQQAAQLFGPEEAAKLDPVYNPDTVARNQQQAMSVKDQMERQYKALTFGETQRHNQATEGIGEQTNTIRASQATQAKIPSGFRMAADGATLEPIPGGPAAQKQNAPPKPLPAAALKMQQEGLDAIGTAKSINADLDAINTQITDGKLDFGPVSNLYNKARNATGTSTEASRNFASFQANMEKLRNDSLRLNKGVQTDGDAQRAWNELFSNINDPKVVQQRLGEIKALNERAVQLRKLDIDNVRQNYGHEPLDTTGYEKQPAALNGGNKAPPAAPLDAPGIEAEMRRRGLLK